MSLQDLIKTSFARYRFVVYGVVVFGLGVMLGSSMKMSSGSTPVSIPVEVSQEEATSKIAVEQLNDIQSQLAMLQQEIKKPVAPVNLTPIKLELNKLGKVVESVKVKESGTAQRLLGENKALNDKIDAVNLTLSELNKTQTPIRYLEPNALPFKVLAIDNIQEQSVLAVEYNFHPLALEKGDEVAGWKVVSLDYSKQRAEFENKDHAHVQLSLTQLG